MALVAPSGRRQEVEEEDRERKREHSFLNLGDHLEAWLIVVVVALCLLKIDGQCNDDDDDDAPDGSSSSSRPAASGRRATEGAGLWQLLAPRVGRTADPELS